MRTWKLLAVLAGSLLIPGTAAGQTCLSGEVDVDDADRSYDGDHQGDWFGLDVAGIGNVKGFSKDEAVILTGLLDGDADAGQTYVVENPFLGPYYYQKDLGSHGLSAGPAGDVDGDGRPDWIAGGETSKVYSGATGAVIALFAGEASGDDFGHSVAALGDFDGNGYDDIAVGAPFNTAGVGDWACAPNAQSGRVYVFLTPDGGYASPAPTVDAEDADIIFTGNPGDWLGFDIAAGDVNDDAVPDLLMTAPYARWDPDACSTWGGKAYIFFMCSGLETPVEFGELTGEEEGFDLDEDVNVVIDMTEQAAFFGWSIDAGSDFDDGGQDDFVIGTYKWRVESQGKGKAYVYYSEDLDLGSGCDPAMISIRSEDARLQIVGEQDAIVQQGGGEQSVSFGWDVVFTNIDNDDFADLVVGGPYYDEGLDPPLNIWPEMKDSGAVWVFYGTDAYTTQTDLNSEDDSDIKFIGAAEDDRCGWSVGNHGLADGGNSYEDLIMGAPGFDSQRGRVYVFLTCVP